MLLKISISHFEPWPPNPAIKGAASSVGSNECSMTYISTEQLVDNWSPQPFEQQLAANLQTESKLRWHARQSWPLPQSFKLSRSAKGVLETAEILVH